MPWLKRGINQFIPSIIWQLHPPLKETLAKIPPEKIVLDIGAGGRQARPDILGVDFLPLPNTQIVADIHALPFAAESVSGIICTGTLEHVMDPHLALAEMYRVLKLGTLIHLEVPFMQPFHRDPEDYWRWTLDGLRLFAKNIGFEEIQSGSHLRSQSAMNALLIAYWQSWFKNQYIRKGIDFVLSWLLWPLKFLDNFMPSDTLDMPSAVYFVGRKQ
jgi:SAM-dependent methyltransferase